MKKTKQRHDYALKRMSLAIERMLGNGSKEEKLQAAQWIGAWKAGHAVYLAAYKRHSSGVGGSVV